MTMDIHPAAEFFPTLGEAEFEAFKSDIASQGLLEAIWLCEGKILDGRNRYRACCELGIEPQFRTYGGESPIAFAWSLNGERRHLTNGQRAAIGAEMLPALREESRLRQVSGLRRGQQMPVRPELTERAAEGQKASQAAAQIVGVSATNIQYAKVIKDRDPDSFSKLKSGELKVATAYRRSKEVPLKTPPRAQPRPVRIAAIKRLALEGNRAGQIAEQLHMSESRVMEIASAEGIPLHDTVLGHSYKIKARRVIEETVSTLEGVALGLRTIDGARLEASPHEVVEWLKSIDDALRVISRVRKLLREYTK